MLTLMLPWTGAVTRRGRDGGGEGPNTEPRARAHELMSKAETSADKGDHRIAVDLYVAALQSGGLEHREVALNNLALSFEQLGM